MLSEPEFDEELDDEDDLPVVVESARPSVGVSDYVVDQGDAGARLDRYLVSRLTHISRNHVQNLIDQGRVRVNDVSKKPSHRLEVGERVVIEIPEPTPVGVEPENIPLDMVYSDADIAVINKPAGMIVHPGAGEDSGTLVAALLHHFGGGEKLSTLGGPLRPGIVHRLDKDTSGLIVVA
ncbi:MAG: RluA family pseudouridine synthase, partial [Candidatus Acidiferrales bacterium]